MIKDTKHSQKQFEWQSNLTNGDRKRENVPGPETVAERTDEVESQKRQDTMTFSGLITGCVGGRRVTGLLG